MAKLDKLASKIVAVKASISHSFEWACIGEWLVFELDDYLFTLLCLSYNFR